MNIQRRTARVSIRLLRCLFSRNMTGLAMRTLRMAGSGFVAVELSDTQASMASMLLPSGSCTNAA